MPRHTKQVHVRNNRGHHETLEAETVEQALKDLAKKVKHGDVELPFSVDFEGPGGSKFSIMIESADAAQEISTMGFMF